MEARIAMLRGALALGWVLALTLLVGIVADGSDSCRGGLDQVDPPAHWKELTPWPDLGPFVTTGRRAGKPGYDTIRDAKLVDPRVCRVAGLSLDHWATGRMHMGETFGLSIRHDPRADVYVVTGRYVYTGNEEQVVGAFRRTVGRRFVWLGSTFDALCAATLVLLATIGLARLTRSLRTAARLRDLVPPEAAETTYRIPSPPMEAPDARYTEALRRTARTSVATLLCMAVVLAAIGISVLSRGVSYFLDDIY
jgi:hypothetical protein